MEEVLQNITILLFLNDNLVGLSAFTLPIKCTLPSPSTLLSIGLWILQQCPLRALWFHLPFHLKTYAQIQTHG